MDERDVHGRLRIELLALRSDLDDRLGDNDLSSEVERALRQRSDTANDSWLKPRRRVAAVLLVGLLTVLATPPARAAMSRFFQVGAVTLEPAEKPAPTVGETTAPHSSSANLGRFAGLGAQTSLDRVRRRMSVSVPTADGLRLPDQVRFESSSGPHASLVYRSGPGLPEIPHTDGVGLVIEEFVGDGRTMVHKYLLDRTVAEPTDINGRPGVYLSGGPHLLFYEDGMGRDIQVGGRTAGRALIFQHGDLTIRIEGNLNKDRMNDIARNL